ncbi:MAG: tetratricopeptide repeat protein [Deltaproteobacteria bacterium]|nr:tetratricopeptide repeat protein [Deltaproteobacteria bacterium]
MAKIKDISPRTLDLSLILVLTALSFFPALLNEFVWDDFIYVVPNQVYQSFDLKGIFFGLGNSVEYLHIKDLTLAIDMAIWGQHPFGFHLTNLAIYLITLVVMYNLVRNLANCFAMTGSRGLAFWVTIIFAIHPLQSEIVNFITARNTLLSGLFLFSSLGLLLTGLQKNDAFRIGGSFLLYLLAVFSKAIAVFFPVFLVFFLWVLPVRKSSARLKIFSFVGHALITLLAVMVHISVASSSGVMKETLISFGSAQWEYPLVKAVKIIFFYLHKFFLPYPLSVDYQMATGADHPLLLLSCFGLLAIALVLITVKFGKAYPLAKLGMVWFFAALLPVLNFFPTVPVVADRYTYFSIFGLALVVVSVLSVALSGRKIIFALGLAIIFLWSGMSFSRSLDWKNDLTLWSAAIQANPASTRVNLAEALWREGRYEDALEQLRLEKENNGMLLHRYNFYKGLYKLNQGALDDAIAAFQQALLDGGSSYKEVHLNLAKAYEQTGNQLGALEHFLQVLEVKGGSDAFGTLSKQATAGIERIWSYFEPRRRALEQAALSNPRDFERQFQYATFLHALGQYTAADEYYLKAINLNPSRWETHFNMGLILEKQGRFADAIEAFQKAYDLNPQNLSALNHIGKCFVKLENYPKAEKFYLQAIETNPNFFFATFNLAKVYFATGNKTKAQEYFLKAQELCQQNPEYCSSVERFLGKLASH